MKTIRWIVAGVLLAGLMSAGCLISGQFTVPVNLPDPLDASSATTITPAQIDLNDESVYADHKDDLQGLVDCALLGLLTNTGSTAVDVVVYMTPGLTTHTTLAALNGDATRVQLWGPFQLANGATNVKIDWNKSAALFSKTGKDALITEVKGDGAFTVYFVGATAPASVRLTKGVAVVVIDAKSN